MTQISSINVKWSNRNLSITTDDKHYTEELVETYQVTTDDGNGDPAFIRLYAPFPRQGAPHPSNPFLQATGEVRINQLSPIFYEIEVPYKSPKYSDPDGGGNQPQDKPQNKPLEPPSTEKQLIASEEPIDSDWLGKPIATICGEQFDPPITDTIYDKQLTISLNVFSEAAADYPLNHGGFTNSTIFRGQVAGTVKLTNYHAKDFVDPESGTTYWRCTWTFLARKVRPTQFNESTWYKRIRAEGYKAKNNENPAKVVNAQETKALTDAARQDETNRNSVSPTPKLHEVLTGRQIDDPNKAEWYYFDTTPGTFNFNAYFQ